MGQIRHVNKFRLWYSWMVEVCGVYLLQCLELYLLAILYQQVYYKLLCSSLPVAHRVTSSVTTYGYRDPLLPYIVQMLLLFPFPYVFHSHIQIVLLMTEKRSSRDDMYSSQVEHSKTWDASRNSSLVFEANVFVFITQSKAKCWMLLNWLTAV